MKNFSNILFVVTTDRDVSSVFEKAVALAENNQAKLTLLGVIDGTEETKKEAAKGKSELLNTILELRQKQILELVRNLPGKHSQLEIKIVVGIAFIEIIREVQANQRDLVIKMADTNTGLDKKLFGSMDKKLLRQCPCPLWLIRSAQQKGFRELLVGLDYDPQNKKVDELNGELLETAASFALADFNELHVVHAWSLRYESMLRSRRTGYSDAEVDKMVEEEGNIRWQWLTDIVKKHCGSQGKEVVDYLKPKLHLIKGDASNVVLNCAEDIGAELVVLGTVCRTGIPGFIIGNTAEDILNHISSSVLAIKPPGFVSPVK